VLHLTGFEAIGHVLSAGHAVAVVTTVVVLVEVLGSEVSSVTVSVVVSEE